MSQTIQVFPRSFAPGDTPNVVAILYSDEEELTGASAVADLYRLEIAEPVVVDLEAEATESESGILYLVSRLSADLTAELSRGVYFLRFRAQLGAQIVVSIPPDDRLRLRCT